MARLFIAEKPSLGRAIAASLGGARNKCGYIECASGDVVTWGFGHMLELCDPDEYDERYKKWTAADLPIIPAPFRLRPKKDAAEQIKIVRALLKDCTTVVNAGDPDREGQLLIDELLQHLGNRKPVMRLWLAATDDESVRKALVQLRDNTDYHNLCAAAETRQFADWLIGINATRALTLAAQQQGHRGVLSVGRVQTPTLALAVQREREIRNFVPKDYFVVTAAVKHTNGPFGATYQPPQDGPGLDPEGYLIDRAVAERVAREVTRQDGRIVEATSEHKKQAAPMPHTLATLQKEGSARYSMTAQKVLDFAQALYEKGLLSYPRTECAYLPEEQLGNASAVLRMLAKAGTKGADKTQADLRSKAWNTAKVEAHHGIVPTGESPHGLSDGEQKVFDMAAERFVMQFLPPYEYLSMSVLVDIKGHLFKATGNQILAEGWRVAAHSQSKETALPAMKKGDPVQCTDTAVEAKRTEPPARYTDGTLLEAMSSVHKYVEDPKIKALLKETSGLGTPATRANIIETLFKREYLARKGKQIMPTDRGEAVYDAVPVIFRDPGMTALWEDALKEIEQGTRSQASFLDDLKNRLPKLVGRALEARFDGLTASTTPTTHTQQPRRKSRR